MPSNGTMNCTFGTQTKTCTRCGWTYPGLADIATVRRTCPAPDNPAVIARLPETAGEICPTCPEHGLSEHGLMIVCKLDSGCSCKAKPVIAMVQRLYGKRAMCQPWRAKLSYGAT